MKLQNKQNHKKSIIVAVISLVLLTGSVLAYIYVFNGSLLGWEKPRPAKVNDVDYNKPTTEQQDAGKDIESRNSSDDPNQVGSDKAPQSSSNGNTKAETAVTVTSSGQNGNVLQVRALISALANSGTCTITLTNKTNTVTKTAQVQSLPSSSTCKGFDIPTTELSVGNWQYSLLFENETMKGSTGGSVTIQQVTQ